MGEFKLSEHPACTFGWLYRCSDWVVLEESWRMNISLRMLSVEIFIARVALCVCMYNRCAYAGVVARNMHLLFAFGQKLGMSIL